MKITPDEDFKKDFNTVRKKAEQALEGALVKFHHRHVKRLKNTVQQAQISTVWQKLPRNLPVLPQTPARNGNTKEEKNEKDLAKVLKAKIREVDTMLEQMRAVAENK